MLKKICKPHTLTKLKLFEILFMASLTPKFCRSTVYSILHVSTCVSFNNAILKYFFVFFHCVVPPSYYISIRSQDREKACKFLCSSELIAQRVRL